MSKLPKDGIHQAIITNGCLQILYINSCDKKDDSRSSTIKSYAEHLDIFLVFEGQLNLSVFNTTRQLNPGDLFFCTRSTYVEIQSDSEAFSYVRLRFLKHELGNRELEKRFAASILGCDIVKQKIFNHCLSFIDFFDRSFAELSEREAAIVHAENIEILSILEIMISQEHENLDIIRNKVMTNHVIVKAVNLFEDNIETNMKVNEVAEQVHVSQSYFIRIFKKHVGVVPNVFWRTMKINHSLSLISLKLESICEISYLLGFTDQSHFTNCFKKYLHTTPGNISG